MTIESILINSIKSDVFPNSLEDIFGTSLRDGKIYADECSLFDFKGSIPSKLSSDPYGFGIIKSIIAMHNCYGGCILFGVQKDGEIIGVDKPLDIESINSYINDLTGQYISVKSKTIFVQDKKIISAYVKKRTKNKPLKIGKTVIIHYQGKKNTYSNGSVFFRRGHETILAKPEDIRFLYSKRSSIDQSYIYPVQRSIPPSASTINNYIGRFAIQWSLWEWLFEECTPRFYLYGAGGSGKSTLAYEFSKELSDIGADVNFCSGKSPDYIIYLTAKETELNTATKKIQNFSGKDFSNKKEMYQKILINGGYRNEEDIIDFDEDELESVLKNFFNEYSGLIVIDDIDSLSRRGEDTAEEKLYNMIARSVKNTKILYTMRNAPLHALSSAKEVVGLHDHEYDDFLKACYLQFSVPEPKPLEKEKIKESSSVFPLMIETIVGMRRYEETYTSAITVFNGSGGAEARKYLYDREYRIISRKSRVRNILFGIDYYGEKITFREIVSIFNNIPRDEISGAISELRVIFLTVSEDEKGETCYGISPSSSSYLKDIYYDTQEFLPVKRLVETFISGFSSLNKEEMVELSNIRNLIKNENYDEAVTICSQIQEKESIISSMGEFQSLYGQALCLQRSPQYELAIACFGKAELRSYSDIFMMRSWFFICMKTERRLDEADKVCLKVIENPNYLDRAKSEFYLKRGDYFLKKCEKARFEVSRISRKYIENAIANYIDSIISSDGTHTDESMAYRRLIRSFSKYQTVIKGEPNQILDFLERRIRAGIYNEILIRLSSELWLEEVKKNPPFQENLRFIRNLNARLHKLPQYDNQSDILKPIETAQAELENILS